MVKESFWKFLSLMIFVYFFILLVKMNVQNHEITGKRKQSMVGKAKKKVTMFHSIYVTIDV